MPGIDAFNGLFESIAEIESLRSSSRHDEWSPMAAARDSRAERLWQGMRHMAVDRWQFEEGIFRPAVLEHFLGLLPDGSYQSRFLLQQLLTTCNGVRLDEHSVAILRDGLKQKLWGILCPRCDDEVGAPKWVRGTPKRKMNGIMQCTHTGSNGKTTNHAGWAFVRSDIVVADRPQIDMTTRMRKGGKFASLEQK